MNSIFIRLLQVSAIFSAILSIYNGCIDKNTFRKLVDFLCAAMLIVLFFTFKTN